MPQGNNTMPKNRRWIPIHKIEPSIKTNGIYVTTKQETDSTLTQTGITVYATASSFGKSQ